MLKYANLHSEQSIGNGIKDNIQVYNIPKFDGFHERHQPPVLEENIKEIEAFAKVSPSFFPINHSIIPHHHLGTTATPLLRSFTQKCHDEVVVKLLRLFAILLELPNEHQLARDHQYEVKGEDHLRYMHYAARSREENKTIGELYVPGHTDLGSITLLFRQPVCGLQILNSDGEWKWVVSECPCKSTCLTTVRGGCTTLWRGDPEI